MCTRFVYNGTDTITGFNFDIDLAVWNHTITKEKDLFSIGIKMPDHQYHPFHGINANGNAGTLLYVHGNSKGAYSQDKQFFHIAEITERFIKGELSFEQALRIAESGNIMYAPDATMQAMLSDQNGRVLMIEPGIGYKVERNRYSLITNYSLLQPQTTKPYVVPGDNRYERAKELLDKYGDDFTVDDAFSLLFQVRQEGLWATRVSFVYSLSEQKVYYVLNNDFHTIFEHKFV